MGVARVESTSFASGRATQVWIVHSYALRIRSWALSVTKSLLEVSPRGRYDGTGRRRKVSVSAQPGAIGFDWFSRGCGGVPWLISRPRKKLIKQQLPLKSSLLWLRKHVTPAQESLPEESEGWSQNQAGTESMSAPFGVRFVVD